METLFNNVTISIIADTPELAYAKLCDALKTISDCEYTTDTYHTDLTHWDRERPTSDLFPKLD